MIFPKDNLSFSYTFITQDDINNLLSRYNGATNIFEQQTISQEPLMRKLMEKGIIYNISEKEQSHQIYSDEKKEYQFDSSYLVESENDITDDCDCGGSYGGNDLIDIFSFLTEEWNQAHSMENINEFYQLFDNTVLFYGSRLSREECIAKKQSLLHKYAYFKQEILEDDFAVEELDGYYEYKSTFVKRVTVNGKTTDYPSYLIFKKKNNNFVIIAESDLATDKNLAKKK
jgi:hypothetical protein